MVSKLHRIHLLCALFLIIWTTSVAAMQYVEIALYEPEIQSYVVHYSELPVEIESSLGFINKNHTRYVFIHVEGDVSELVTINEVGYDKGGLVTSETYNKNAQFALRKDEPLVIKKVTIDTKDYRSTIVKGAISVLQGNEKLSLPITVKLVDTKYIPYQLKKYSDAADLLEDEPTKMREAAYTYMKAAEYFKLDNDKTLERYAYGRANLLLERILSLYLHNETFLDDLEALRINYNTLGDKTNEQKIAARLIPLYLENVVDDSSSLLKLAEAYLFTGDKEKAQASFEDYVSVLSMQAEQKSSHLVKAEIYEDIAQVYEQLCDYEKANEFYAQSIDSYEYALGEYGINQNKEIASTIYKIATLYDIIGEKERAQENYLTALDSFLKIIRGKETDISLQEYTIKAAKIYFILNNKKKADELLEHIIFTYENQQTLPLWEDGFELMEYLDNLFIIADEVGADGVKQRICNLNKDVADNIGAKSYVDKYKICVLEKEAVKKCLLKRLEAEKTLIDKNKFTAYIALSQTSETEQIKYLVPKEKDLNTIKQSKSIGPADHTVLTRISVICQSALLQTIDGPFNISLFAKNNIVYCNATMPGGIKAIVNNKIVVNASHLFNNTNNNGKIDNSNNLGGASPVMVVLEALIYLTILGYLITTLIEKKQARMEPHPRRRPGPPQKQGPEGDDDGEQKNEPHINPVNTFKKEGKHSPHMRKKPEPHPEHDHNH